MGDFITQSLRINYYICHSTITYTVRESLIAVKKAHPLSNDEVNDAIDKLIKHANNLPDSLANDEIKTLAKQGLLNITKKEFLKNKESVSKLSVAEILAYFYINLQRIKDTEQRNNALSIFYAQLSTLVRDFSLIERGNITLDVNATIVQLTIALQAVCPDLVWVSYADFRSLALNGFNFLPDILCEAYKNTGNKERFAKLCAIKSEDFILTDEVWSQIEEKLKQQMKASLYNSEFKPARCVFEDEKLVNDIVKEAVKVIKSGSSGMFFTEEMKKPAEKINGLLNEIVLSAGDYAKFCEQIVMRRPRSEDATKKLCLMLNLDKSILMLEKESKIAPPKATRVSIEEFYLYSLNSTRIPLGLEIDNDLITRCKKHACKQLPPEQLPDTFRMMAADKELLEKLLTAHAEARKVRTGKFDISLLFGKSKAASKWLSSKDDFNKTLQILGIPQRKDNERPDTYFYEISFNIFQALMHLAPEMIDRSTNTEVQKQIVFAHSGKKTKM